MVEAAYFDNAATSFPKPEVVYQAMDDCSRHWGGSAGRGTYEGAQEAGKLLADARAALQRLFHTDSHEVILAPSATEALNLVLRGSCLREGAVVYISPFEHNAVLRPLYHLRKMSGICLETLKVDRESLSYDLEGIKYQFQDKPPTLVSISHASNVCGLVAPAAAIFALAKEYGALTVLDMSQTAGLLDLDIVAAQVDCAVFAGHKTLLGPFGASGMLLRQGMQLEPLLFGGTGLDSANPDMPDSGPARYEAGSHNTPAFAGLRAALGWIEAQGIERVLQREQSHKERLLQLLGKYGFIRVIRAPQQLGVVSTVFADLASDDAGHILAERGIAVRTGLHCAPEAHRFLGTFPAGTVRFSVSCLTGEKDFSLLKCALNDLEANL